MASEKSVKSSYTVVYNLKSKKWVVAGEGGWSEIHLCRDSIDGTHRLLAWTCSEEQDVLMNCNVTAECIYKEKSNNFHSFTDENGDRYGLGFHKSEAGLRQAAELLTSVISVIEECKMAEAAAAESMALPPPVPGGHYSPGMPPPTMSAMSAGSASTSAGLPRVPSPGPSTTTTVSSSGMPPPVPPAVPGASRSPASSPRTRPNPPKAVSPRASPRTSPRPHSPRNAGGGAARPPPPPGMGLGASAFSTPAQSIAATYSSVTDGPSGMESYEFASGGFDTAMSPASPHVPLQQSARTEHTMPLPSRAAPVLGDLVILPPKAQKQQRSDASVKLPHAVSHVRHVSYDHEQGVYVGLPPEWMEELNRQFGVRPTDLQGIQLNYMAKIPKVLVDLKNKVMEKEGYRVTGIFRLAPNAQENEVMKQHINRGEFQESPEMDVNVYANLIKVWFRDLPEPLLSCVDPDAIESVESVDDAGRVMMEFAEPNKSILLWLCDMCVEIARFEDTNKMGPQNLAIVIGPNLFNTDSIENPMRAMTFSGKVVSFLHKCILWRQQHS